MDAITFDSVNVRGKGTYNGLNNISFILPENGILAIIGPKGSGKKEIYQLLAGFKEPDYGTCKVFGNDCYKDAIQVHKIIGFSDAESFMYPEYTLEENIEIIAEQYGINKESLSSRFSLLAHKLGLWDSRTLLYSKLNISDKIKASLLRASIHSPKVLVIYNIFASLNRDAFNEVKDFLAFLIEKENISILMLSEISDYFFENTDYIILEEGSAVCSGKAQDIIKNSELKNRVIIKTANNKLQIAEYNVIPKKGYFIILTENPDEISEVIKQAVIHDNRITEARVEEVTLEEAYNAIIENYRGQIDEK